MRTKRPLLFVLGEGIAMRSNSQNFVDPVDDAERAYFESLIREDFARCHPDDSLDDMKRRSIFSKEDRGLLRDWMAVAAMRAAALEETPRLMIAAE
jgi:hypothetical protein